jgi:hypothetical protein
LVAIFKLIETRLWMSQPIVDALHAGGFRVKDALEERHTPSGRGMRISHTLLRRLCKPRCSEFATPDSPVASGCSADAFGCRDLPSNELANASTPKPNLIPCSIFYFQSLRRTKKNPASRQTPALRPTSHPDRATRLILTPRLVVG